MKRAAIAFFFLITISHSIFCVVDTFQTPFFSVTTDRGSAYVFHIPAPQQVNNYKKLFFHACFDFPYILEQAHQKNVPLILAIPEQYHSISTTEKNAPIIEGARIALAWASAYCRFDNLGCVDVRTLLVSNDATPFQTMHNIVAACQMNFDSNSNLTPEEKMARSIIHASTLPVMRRHPNLQIQPLSHERTIPPKKIISPQKHSGKTLLITGVAGFLGSYLAQAFLDKNYTVIGIDNFACSTGENLKSLHNHSHFEFYEFDISQPFEVEGPVDFIAHLASIPSPADYYKMPIETLRSGLHGARNALELAAKKNARILLASSSEVYGNPEVHPQHESYKGNVNPIAMRSQYDESKRGEETLAKLFYDKHAIDIRIARIFNTFGPGMRLSDGRVMTNFIQAALTKKPMIVHGDGTQTRSPAFVTDTINGLISLLESESITQFTSIEQRIFNVGTPKEYSVNQIADAVNKIAQKHMEYTVPVKHIPHIDPTDPKIRRPDISYIHKVTGFEPNVEFEIGLERMFMHYYANTAA